MVGEPHKSGYQPTSQIESHDFLYGEVRVLQGFLSELKDLQKEEKSVSGYLRSIHIALVTDIVG